MAKIILFPTKNEGQPNKPTDPRGPIGGTAAIKPILSLNVTACFGAINHHAVDVLDSNIRYYNRFKEA